jgi:hypothetical protein
MLNLTIQFAAVLPDGSDLSSPQEALAIPILGSKGIKYNGVAGSADDAFNLGGVGTIGYVRLKNLAAYVEVITPATPVVTPNGTPGAATWSYKIVAKQADGSYSAASAAGSTGTGNATLTTGNFNRITWTAVPGADSYDIYRTAHGTSPSTDGLIGNTANTAFSDTGLAGDASTPPATGIDNVMLYGDLSADYPLSLKGGEVAVFRWNAAAIHFKRNTAADVPWEIAILDA